MAAPSGGVRVYEGMKEDQIVQRGDGTQPTIFRRKVIRRIEEPVKRQVRVPVRVKTVVPCEYSRRVPVTKHIEVTDFEDVEETYTEMVEETRTRDKIIWLPTTVQETYQDVEQVTEPVTVKTPIKRIVPQEEVVTVMVKGTKVVKEKGYRIDEIKEIVKVQIEEWEHFRLIPSEPIVEQAGQKDVEVVSQSLMLGNRIYTQEDLNNNEDLQKLETINADQFSQHQIYVPDYQPAGAQGQNYHQQQQQQPQQQQQQEQYSSGFDLDICLEYINKKLSKKLKGHAGAFCQQLRMEYKYFDRTSSGSFTPQHLRKGIWFRDPANKGVPVPAGNLGPRLQNDVDSVLRVCQQPGVITFWDYAQFLLSKHHGPKLTITYPNKPWAGPPGY
mmetsp:Transcript_22484/g.44569  ORF Transcript_22484/g.44569 Transcript_22484/m.44569 type:complete len:385 (-) Transcript_22484:204-1358(-)